MRKINRSNLLAGFIIGVMCISALAACGGRRAQPEAVPTNPPQATTVLKPTTAPQKVQPTATAVPAQPTTAPTVAPTATSEPSVTPAPAATATSAAPAKSTVSGAALDQVLEQLFNANNSADSLDDVPQLK